MLVSVLPVPFGDAGRQRQYDAVRAALEAETDAPATVLLGNLEAFSPIRVDVLVVRPTGLALVILMPQAGQLTMHALTHGAWQLDGQPLPSRAEADNSFAQYQQQLPLALAWLSEHLGLPEAELPPCTGIALFDAPLTFGPEVEAQLHRHAAAHDFQLMGGAGQLPARLRWPLATDAMALKEDELLDWGEYLANDQFAAQEQDEPESPTNFLAQKLRQLWRWLGAEDIPADPPYGGPPPGQHLRDQQEQAHLHQLRQELQAELHQQRQEAAAREALRTQELALLRQQLTQAGPSPTERAAEQRAKAALEESLRTTRAELATRNDELDARIQQLGQLIGQLQAAPAAPPTAPAPSGLAAASGSVGPVAGRAAAPATVPRPRPAAAPRRSFRRLRQAERWGLVALVLAGAGAGTWGVVRRAHHAGPRPAAAIVQRAAPDETVDERQSADQSDPADSLADAQTVAVDTAATPAPQSDQTAAEPAAAPELITQPAVLHIDSAKVIDKAGPLIMGADSAASPSPAP